MARFGRGFPVPFRYRITRVGSAPPAGPQFVQQALGQSSAASTTLSAVFGVAPTAGNLLVFEMAGDKNTGALTLAGWTVVYELLSTSVSLYLDWKVSDGTETTVSPSWATSSAAGNMAWVGEYSDIAAGTWTLLASASNITNEISTTTWATGTTAATGRTATAMAGPTSRTTGGTSPGRATSRAGWTRAPSVTT